MFEKFNAKFTVYTTDSTYSIENSDFDESKMLEDIYPVCSFGDLIIPAPENCSSYTWTIKVPQSAPDGVVVSTERILNYKAPGILNPDLVNGLILTVQDKQGNEYTDMAKIILN